MENSQVLEPAFHLRSWKATQTPGTARLMAAAQPALEKVSQRNLKDARESAGDRAKEGPG